MVEPMKKEDINMEDVNMDIANEIIKTFTTGRSVRAIVDVQDCIKAMHAYHLRMNEQSGKQKFEICLWVHTDIDEPDTTFTILGKNKEEVQKNIDYINSNCLREDRRLEIVE